MVVLAVVLLFSLGLASANVTPSQRAAVATSVVAIGRLLPNDMRAALLEEGLLPNEPQAAFLKDKVVT